jgi:predicted acylesterase/phospholipase RssA
LARTETRLNGKWWFLATVAEAHFGLRDYEPAAQWLQRAKELPETPLWEFESAAVQLASLAQLQHGMPEEAEQAEQTRAWAVLQAFLDNKADAVRTAFAGKFGLALSGGGFRASFYHIGVLAKLAELDLLRHIHVLSCVSGGSIVGTHYYLEVRKLLQEKYDTVDGGASGNEAITREDYVAIVERVQQSFLEGVQRNIRVRVVGNPFANLRMICSRSYSRTTRAGELFEKELYSRVDDGGGTERYIDELKIQPRGETDFNPKERNWLRRNKVPMLVLNATTLNTGHNWQFTASWMGESPFAIDPEIDCNWRYRRMYYHEAPERYRKVRLGLAVGASACVPGLFEPVVLPDLYPKEGSAYPEMTVRLVDGGVHDNQGIASLLEQDCNVLFVSDASGQMTSEPNPKAGVLGPMLRTNSTLMERVRLAQFADLKARARTSVLKSLVVVHLKKGLAVDPISWKRCKEPPDSPLQRRSELLSYGVLGRIQESLAALRTDLDSFSEIEAHALMASGYMMTEECAEQIRGYARHKGPRHGWDFLRIEPALRGNAPTERQQDAVEKLLRVGAERAFKIWRISPVLQAVAAGLGVAAVALFAWGWLRYPEFTLLHVDLDWLGWAACWALATMVLGKGVAALRYKETLRKVLKDLAIAVFGWVAASVHLRLFDPLFLRRGRIRRIL